MENLDVYLGQLHPNLRAFADAIGVSEGTSTHPLTRCGGYDVIVTGIDAQGKPTPEIFTDFSTHPFSSGRRAKVINRAGLQSTASGKFQLLERYWAPYKLQLRLQDFGPVSQIRVALQQVKEQHAFDDVLTGHIAIAIAKCCDIWASLPGHDNTYGQPINRLAALEDAYEQAGGKFA